MTNQRYRPDLSEPQKAPITRPATSESFVCGPNGEDPDRSIAVNFGGQAKPRKVDEPEADELDRLRADRDLFKGQRDAARKQVSELNFKLQKCREYVDRARRAYKSFWGDIDRLKAENETLRKQGSVYNGKSAEEWYTLYCQSVLGSDSVSGDTRDADVMRDDLPEYLL